MAGGHDRGADRAPAAMNRHRWWLALLAAVLTPWVGPHLDRYVPVGWVLLQAASESVDAGFWLLAGVLLAVGYGIWFALLTLAAAGLSRLRRPGVPTATQREL
jgi:hypothetical protein